MIAKTPETLTREARRAIGASPLRCALSGDATAILKILADLVDRTQAHVAGPRFVSMLDLRNAVDQTPGSPLGARFDRAVRELGSVYRVYLCFAAGETTRDEDNASVLCDGTSRHRIALAFDWT